jgi:uncharacterized protein (DUF2147 family)
MLTIIKRTIGPLAVALAASGSPALAASSPLGVWIDHTGRGAVEITDCGGKLCGHLVWFQDAKNNAEGCNFQIIGNVKPMAGNKWDGGWIIDPDKDPNKKYDVEITPQGENKLKVMGYAGMKFLSETMIWTRARPDLQKCGSDVARAPEPAPAPGPAPGQANDPPAAANPAPAPAPAPEEAKPERSDKTAQKGKKGECKMDLSFAVITFPCPD